MTEPRGGGFGAAVPLFRPKGRGWGAYHRGRIQAQDSACVGLAQARPRCSGHFGSGPHLRRNRQAPRTRRVEKAAEVELEQRRKREEV